MSAPIVERANPRGLPAPLVGVCGLLLVVGLVAFFGGLSTDPETTWRAFHVNFLYFGALSQAALCLACAFVIIGARWPGPVRHVAAGLAAWVPISLVLYIVVTLGGREYIYAAWDGNPPYGKEAWLNFSRMFWVDVGILLVLTVLTLVFIKTAFRPYLHGAAERATLAKGLFESWTANWKGDEAELEESQRKLKVLAPIICLVYAFGFTVIAYDTVMSLQPTFYSNIFGWYFGWGAWLSAVAATALISVLLRNTPGWQGQITRARMHDLGKMVFAFSIFWMYLFFSQYIVVWYGNLPEETQFFTPRLGSQFLQHTWYFVSDRLNEPYVRLSLTAWVGCWIIPFWVLLGQRPKRTWFILGPVAAAVLLGFWLERNALIWPALVPDDGSAWLGGIQIGLALGFFGAFSLVFLVFSRVFPTLPVPQAPAS